MVSWIFAFYVYGKGSPYTFAVLSYYVKTRTLQSLRKQPTIVAFLWTTSVTIDAVIIKVGVASVLDHNYASFQLASYPACV